MGVPSKEVLDSIPQKPPFLFVDKVVDRTSNTILTNYLVTGKESFFEGHFPGNPIFPGVILQEALFQTGALLISLLDGNGLGVVSRVNNVKFRELVRPNDILEMTVELEEQIGNAFVMKGKTRVNGKIVAVLEFTCAVINE